MQEELGFLGIPDHTKGIEIPIAAAALGSMCNREALLDKTMKTGSQGQVWEMHGIENDSEVQSAI